MMTMGLAGKISRNSTVRPLNLQNPFSSFLAQKDIVGHEHKSQRLFWGGEDRQELEQLRRDCERLEAEKRR